MIVAIVIEKDGKRIFRHDVDVTKTGDLEAAAAEALRRFRLTHPTIEPWEDGVIQRYLKKEEADA